jgi:cytochrome bd-type quinol oxidase subunit 1
MKNRISDTKIENSDKSKQTINVSSEEDTTDREKYFFGRMKRFWLLAIAFVVFFAIVGLYIYPSQNGMISSTELSVNQINNTDPLYNETLPIQDVGINNQGRSIFIAFVMLSHVIFANLHLGGSWVAVGSESIFLLRKKNRFNRIAKSMTLFNVILFSFGATFAVAGMLFFISLFPTFASNVFHIYWWPLLVEAILFATEIAFLYTYWFSWKKLSKKWHQVLGYGYAVSVFFQTLMINMLAGGMLTPGIQNIQYYGSGILPISLGEAFATWFNPTLWNLQWHRLFASIAFIGFILAMLGAFHYIDRKGKRDRKYWDWVASYGLSWGLLGLVIQPFLGLLYMWTIFGTNNGAFQFIMHGPRAWEMLLMIGAIAFLFLTIILYFIERREKVFSDMETKYLHKLFIIFFVIAAIAGFFLVQPSWLNGTYIYSPTSWVNPIGQMTIKYIALGVLVLIGVMMLMIDVILLGRPKEAHWGDLTYSARGCLILSGLLGIFIILAMGFVRESARSPWTFSYIIPVAGGMSNPTPLSFVNILFVWIFASIVILIAFWFTSKATAHHPEKAEEI